MLSWPHVSFISWGGRVHVLINHIDSYAISITEYYLRLLPLEPVSPGPQGGGRGGGCISVNISTFLLGSSCGHISCQIWGFLWRPSGKHSCPSWQVKFSMWPPDIFKFKCPPVAPLPPRCLMDGDDEVRDRALLYLEILKQKQKSLSSRYILSGECHVTWNCITW